MTADLVVENARIWSNGLNGFAPFAAARHGRFIHVGRRDEALIGADTRRVDAGGRVVVPGLIDSHVHLLWGGMLLSRLNLRDAASRADFVRRVGEWAATLPAGAWILGGRWNDADWPDGQSPRKEWLDPVTGGRPACLRRMDGHSAVVNSAALRLAGIDPNGPADPEGGRIDRDPATGEPTGILRESAMGLVERLVPEPTVDEKVAALHAGAAHAIEHGITAVGDIVEPEDLPAYQRVVDDGDLPLRVFMYPWATDWHGLVETIAGFRPRPGFMEVKGLKDFLDGSLGSRTARMVEPYLDENDKATDNLGLYMAEIADGRLRRNLEVARDRGWQPILHAIGDGANRFLLDALEEVYGDALREARARAEHAQHLRPEDVARFGRLGVIASMQPYHKFTDARTVDALLGPERAAWCYSFRSLLESGACVAFGSDWPVVTISPFEAIRTAVTGRVAGDRVWQPGENVTIEEALRCYTSRAAFAAHADDNLGRLAPGFRADFVVLEGDPFEPDLDPGNLRAVEVYIEGRRVFPRG